MCETVDDDARYIIRFQEDRVERERHARELEPLLYTRRGVHLLVRFIRVVHQTLHVVMIFRRGFHRYA